jgi:hypothetical protein
MYAYAWRSGLIGFRKNVPAGSLKITCGRKDEVEAVISVLARHGRGESEGMLLVPGIPEAETDDEALDALIAFCDMVKKQMEKL